MEQSQLLELLSSLSPEEGKQLLEFSGLSYLSTTKVRAQITPLLQVCFQHLFEGNPKELNKQEIFQLIFPEQAYVEGKLEKAMVEAHKMTRNFLISQYFLRPENEFYQHYDFAEIIRQRGLALRHKNTLNKLKKFLEEEPVHHNLRFHQQYLIELAFLNHESIHNKVKGDLNIPNCLDALDLHHYTNRLALFNNYLLQGKVAKMMEPEEMTQRFAETNVPERYLSKSPVLKLNFTIYNLLRKEDHETEDVYLLYELIESNQKNIDTEHLNGYYTYLRNICTLILTKHPDRLDVNQILFDLYKKMLERGFILYEGKIHPSRYLAITDCAIKAAELPWVCEFIEKYKDEIIGENETKDVYRLNLALYNFAIGKYEECADLIPPNPPFVDYLFTSKRLELKVHYELKSNFYSYRLDAFKMFISRTSSKLISEDRKQAYLNFLNFLAQLSASIPGDKKRAETLLKRIQEKKQVAEWRWLLSKAEALKNRNH
ncbi:MAG: hypothetical protein JNJ57_10540 [Saprospiraceae bacterium]|nr:hypothetical protein [Saprospiraceae bacterium]